MILNSINIKEKTDEILLPAYMPWILAKIPIFCGLKPVFVWDKHKRPRLSAPDFYLPPFGIYIEVCGAEEFDYEYRRRIFDNNGYKVIFLHMYKETNKWKNHLISYLEVITNYRNIKLDEMLRIEN